MIKFSEAQEEAIRLTRMLKRSVEVKPVNCDCDYCRHCYMCAGSGIWYELVYSFCSHPVKDDDRDEICFEENCLERERDSLDREPRKQRDLGLAKPLLSIRESAIEEMVEHEDAEVLV